jgi:hypothetical protein
MTWRAPSQRSATRRRALGLLAVAFAVPGLAGSGCGKILGVDGYRVAPPDAGLPRAEAGPTGPCGGYRFDADPACGSCLLGQCCDELTRCRADKTCGGWFACVATCAPEDYDCQGRCGQELKHTNRAIADLSVCRDRCYAPGGDGGGGCHSATLVSAMWGGAPCAACVAQKCDEIGRRYASTPEAMKQSACFLEQDLFTPTPAKLVECSTWWLTPVVPVAQEWQYCAGLTCGLECRMGRWLDCAGHFLYRFSKSASVHVRARVVNVGDVNTAVAYPRARLRACNRTDPLCATPVAEAAALTDTDGYTNIVLAGGFAGYFEVTTEKGDVGLYVPASPMVQDTSLIVVGPNPATGPNPASAPTVPSRPGSGTVQVLLFDCLGSNVRDGTLEASSGVVLYGAATTPEPRALGITSGWVVDATPGVVDLRGLKDGVLIGREQVPVRADTTTWISMLPVQG